MRKKWNQIKHWLYFRERALEGHGEAATTEITRTRDARGFVENKEAARKGRSISGEARQKLEQKTGKSVVNKSVVNSDNYIEITGKVKGLEKDKNLKKLKKI